MLFKDISFLRSCGHFFQPSGTSYSEEHSCDIYYFKFGPVVHQVEKMLFKEI